MESSAWKMVPEAVGIQGVGVAAVDDLVKITWCGPSHRGGLSACFSI